VKVELARTKVSQRLAHTALVAGSLVFALALIELPAFLNLVDYEALEMHGVWGDWRFIRVADPQLTHLQRPYAHYAGTTLGGDAEGSYRIPPTDRMRYQWDLQYDHDGFRNATGLKQADIVVVGDSMVEGMTVPQAQVLSSVLERLTGRVTANLGQYGYGPQQELVVLKRYGLRLTPRIVIWEFCESNDLLDGIGYRAIALHPPNFWNFFLQRSFSRFAIHTVKRLFGPSKPEGITRSGIVQQENGKPATVYFTVPMHPLSEAELGVLPEIASTLAEAHRLTAAQGARMLVVLAPDKFRVYRDVCRFPAESECGRWVLNDLPSRLKDLVAAVSPDIGFLDLTPDLANAARNQRLPYYTDDLHWSPEGHRIAAESVAAYLAAW
jgi:hypothetical protein